MTASPMPRSISGKALRATSVNRLGARLVGIGTTQAVGARPFTLATGLGALCGVLVVQSRHLLRLGFPDRLEGGLWA